MKVSMLLGAKIGIEKESLRVGGDGRIAQTPHPRTLGSPLTHPYITTDYSEALLEFITPPFDHASNTLDFLHDIHVFVYKHLNQELLWSTSMPCIIGGSDAIPIAQYGISNAGMMKTIYRRGLGYRYGRVMQAIAGVHFNYSFPVEFWQVYQRVLNDQEDLKSFIADQYFALIRNLLRIGWLIPYLFGASPAVCKSFLDGKPTSLSEFDAMTYYEPYATSLRMGDIGYTNKKEGETGVKVCYDDLHSYIESLTAAIETPCQEYEKIGVKVNGEWRQLNTNILQIENEYYSSVRAKQPLINNEKPTIALRQRGVEYVELRSLDVNVFEPLGICESEIKFLEVFMAFCLLHDSPLISTQEKLEIDQNVLLVAHQGRDPALCLLRQGELIPLRNWARELFNEMLQVADFIDSGKKRSYVNIVQERSKHVDNPNQTPSAKILFLLRNNKGSFFDFAKYMSQQHESLFKDRKLSAEREAFFLDLVHRSLQQQKQMEDNDTFSFDDYLKQYFSQK